MRFIVEDIRTGDEWSTALASLADPDGEYTRAGTITRSPHGSTRYLAATYQLNHPGNPGVGHILRVNAHNLPNMQVVYRGEAELSLQMSNFSDSNAEICRVDSDPDNYCSLHLNLETGDLSE